MTVMRKCTEETERWPDALADVSQDAHAAFIKHAVDCPYHAARLRAGEEKIRSIFRLARGLDSKGRVLEGLPLQQAVAEHRRRRAGWQEAALRKDLPIRLISLWNNDEEIVGCGKFFDFPRHSSVHDLSLSQGLQIVGILGENVKEKALLGFYRLKGVKHTGEEEFFLLDNGYVIGLRVEHRGGSTFGVDFRCVEAEVIEKELTETIEAAEQNQKAIGATVGGHENATTTTTTPDRPSPATERAMWRKRRFSKRATKERNKVAHIGGHTGVPSGMGNTAARAVLTLMLAISVLPMLFVIAVQSTTASAARNPGTRSVIAAMNSERSVWDKVREVLIVPQGADAATTQNRGALDHALSPSLSLENQAAAALSSVTVENQTSPRAEAEIRREPRNKQPQHHGAQTKRPVADQAARKIAREKLAVTWYLRSILNHGDNPTDESTIIHVVRDTDLRDKLLAEMRGRDLGAMQSGGEDVDNLLSTRQFRLDWDIDRKDKTVEVRATLRIGNESRYLTFSSDGDCQEHACEKAVKDAVFGVYAVMNAIWKQQNGGAAETQSGLSASTASLIAVPAQACPVPATYVTPLPATTSLSSEEH